MIVFFFKCNNGNDAKICPRPEYVEGFFVLKILQIPICGFGSHFCWSAVVKYARCIDDLFWDSFVHVVTMQSSVHSLRAELPMRWPVSSSLVDVAIERSMRLS